MNLRLFILVAPLLCLMAYPASSADKSSRKPYGGKPQTIPGKIEAEHYDEGKPGEVYHDADEANHGVDYRGATQVDIEKRDDSSNGHGIGWIKAGEWVSYSVVVEDSGTYKAEFPVASGKKGGTFHLELDGKDITGPIEVPDTGSFQKLEVISKDNIQLKAGKYVMKMVMDTNGDTGWVMDIDCIRFAKQKP